MKKSVSLIVSLLFSFVGFCNAQVSWVNGFRTDEQGEVNNKMPYVGMDSFVKSLDGVYDLAIKLDTCFNFEIQKEGEVLDLTPYAPFKLTICDNTGKTNEYIPTIINGVVAINEESDALPFMQSLLQPQALPDKNGHWNVRLESVESEFNAEFDFDYVRTQLFACFGWLVEQQKRIEVE